MQFYEAEAESGSLWLSEAKRCEMGWACHTMQRKHAIPIEDVTMVMGGTTTLTVSVECDLQGSGGEQAGLYLYQHEGTWVKIVKEMTRSGIAMVVAKQRDYEPCVVGKVAVPEAFQNVPLVFQIQLGDPMLLVRYNFGGSEWKTVPRKDSPEMPATILLEDMFGRCVLDPGQEATPAAPVRILLMSEQFQRAAKVRFGISKVSQGPKVVP